jgi:hypothetical protein
MAGGGRPGFPAVNQEENMEDKIKDLSLLLMFLTGWEEDSHQNPGEKAFYSWKGYSFKALNRLADEKMIIQSKDKRPTILTEAGKQLAEKLKAQYLH